jgi:hypothetical protein
MPSRDKPHRWSADVMRSSNALDLEEGVFLKKTPRQVALSLKRSADESTRRKSPPFRSAMSMLNFHINRAGRGLSPPRRRILEQAKEELRKLYANQRREPLARTPRRSKARSPS